MPDGNSIVFNDTAGGRFGAVKLVDTTTLKVTVIPDSKNLFMTVTSPDGRYITGLALIVKNCSCTILAPALGRNC
jgi:hypothetical protein